MEINCPNCSRSVYIENTQTTVAKCAYCNSAFDFAGLPDSEAGKVPDSKVDGLLKPTVDIPKGYSVDMQGGDLVITRKWFSVKYLPLLFLCVLWDSFSVLGCMRVFENNGPFIDKLNIVVPGAMGLVITYGVIAFLLNVTRITLSAMEIKIRNSPVPWPGNKILPRQEITQLFCEEKRNQGRGGPYYTYNLSAVMANGKRLKLISGLDKAEGALFLEQKIEGHLGITDTPVPVEMRSLS